MNIAHVVFEIPTKQHFDYLIPKELKNQVQIGSLIRAPFGKKKSIGYVIHQVNQTSCVTLKEISEVLYDRPLIEPFMMRLAKWMAQYYVSSLGLVLKVMLPASVRKGKIPKRKIAQKLMPQGRVIIKNKVILEAQQVRAIHEIKQAIISNKFHSLLLHGVTGSGKTEVYLRAIKHCLVEQKTALMVLPEIVLTPQILMQVNQEFPNQVAILHSQMTDAQRWVEWKKVFDEKVQIVVGVRSAIFAPLKNLGLIIVDEEHERTYKQEDLVPYNARDIAVVRAHLEKCCVVLGSATPSLESYRNAQLKKYQYLHLPERVGKKEMPKIQLVDMKRDIHQVYKGNCFSSELLTAIGGCLDRNEQVILFLNRRGFAPFSICKECKILAECPSCSRAMTLHKNPEKLICHICEYETKDIHSCAHCGQKQLKSVGAGTQKIETQLANIFPKARIQRVDRDSMKKKESAWKMWQEFYHGEIDILIGTQLVAKGFDFPKVSLVGVIFADVTMSLQDFRSGEYTFQLLTQVSGRAGRGNLPGNVIIQTFSPEHDILQCAIQHDYNKFYQYEIALRKQLQFPPFSHFAHLLLTHKNENQLRNKALYLASKIKPFFENQGKLYGPNPSVVYKQKNYYRYSLVLCHEKVNYLQNIIQELQKWVQESTSKDLVIRVDIDPSVLY